MEFYSSYFATPDVIDPKTTQNNYFKKADVIDERYSCFTKFPETNFPTGDFSAIVMGHSSDNIDDDHYTLYLDLVVSEKMTKNLYLLHEKLADQDTTLQEVEFFKFLEDEAVDWGDLNDLEGVFFDTEIIEVHCGNSIRPHICNFKLIA